MRDLREERKSSGGTVGAGLGLMAGGDGVEIDFVTGGRDDIMAEGVDVELGIVFVGRSVVVTEMGEDMSVAGLGGGLITPSFRRSPSLIV